MEDFELSKAMQEALVTTRFATDTVERHVKSIRDFEEEGVMTMDQGFVIQLDDGSEFQITVVKSR